MRTKAHDKTAPEAVSCLRPPARTPADDGSLNGELEILKFSVAAGEIKFKRRVSAVRLKFSAKFKAVVRTQARR